MSCGRRLTSRHAVAQASLCCITFTLWPRMRKPQCSHSMPSNPCFSTYISRLIFSYFKWVLSVSVRAATGSSEPPLLLSSSFVSPSVPRGLEWFRSTSDESGVLRLLWWWRGRLNPPSFFARDQYARRCYIQDWVC